MSKHRITPFFEPVKSPSGKRVYVSGPMTGYPNSNEKAFAEATAKLQMLGYSVCNPVETSRWLGDLSHEEYLRFDFERVLEADFLVALPGWRESKGALAEIFVAIRMGTKVWDWPTFDHYNRITEEDVLFALSEYPTPPIPATIEDAWAVAKRAEAYQAYRAHYSPSGEFPI